MKHKLKSVHVLFIISIFIFFYLQNQSQNYFLVHFFPSPFFFNPLPLILCLIHRNVSVLKKYKNLEQYCPKKTQGEEIQMQSLFPGAPSFYIFSNCTRESQDGLHRFVWKRISKFCKTEERNTKHKYVKIFSLSSVAHGDFHTKKKQLQKRQRKRL